MVYAGLLLFVAWVVFLILSVISYKKKNGKLKKNLILFGITLALFTLVTNIEEKMNTVVWAESEVTSDIVEAVIKQAEGNRTMEANKSLAGISLTDVTGASDNKAYQVHIKLDPGSIWDATHLAKRTADTMVHYSELLFINPSVKEVHLWVVLDFTDQYGNEKQGNAIRITWNRATHEKIQYDNFKEMTYIDYTNAFNVASGYNFHAAIFKDLEDKGGLEMSK